jgi:hypothetical protein
MEMQEKSIPPSEYRPPNDQQEPSFGLQQPYPQVQPTPIIVQTHNQPTPIIVQTSRPVPVIVTGGCPSCGCILIFFVSV